MSEPSGAHTGGDARPLERLIVRSASRILVLTFVAIVLAILAWRLRAILLLVLLSIFVAALLHPAVRLLETKAGRSRLTATSLVYLFLVAVVAAIGFVVVHPLYDSSVH